MFKVILAASCILIPTTFLAYGQAMQSQRMNMVAECALAEESIKYLGSQFGQNPVLSGVGSIYGVDSNGGIGIADGLIVIAANLETGTFSLNITFEDGMNCILARGVNFQPWQGPKGEPL